MIEQSELRQLIVDLDRAQSRAVTEVRGVVERGAVNIKKDWAQRWSGHRRYTALPRAVTYDVAYGLGSVSAQIGPDKNLPQGALGNIIEFGTVHNAPNPGGGPALQTETPKFEKALGQLGERLLG